MKIVEANHDENGAIVGLNKGDQNGDEIVIREWYKRKGGWDYYLECKDNSLADRAAAIAAIIAEDKRFGYSQASRWSGLKAYRAGTGNGDFDCSSLCISAYILAGLDIKAEGYSVNIAKKLMATGRFTQYSDEAHIGTSMLARRGGIYIAPGHHVMMVLGNSATTSSGDASYVLVLGNAVSVRIGAGVTHERIGIAHKGEILPYLGTASTGWYGVNFKGATAYITNNQKYVRLVSNNG